jgi:hypothetical protein
MRGVRRPCVDAAAIHCDQCVFRKTPWLTGAPANGSVRPPLDAANVIDREAATGWDGAAAVPPNCAWQVDWRNKMRAILALSLLISLCASADAATAHHRRHATVSPTQSYSERAVSGFAYAPDGPVVRQAPYPMQYDDQPSVYENRYKNWGG